MTDGSIPRPLLETRVPVSPFWQWSISAPFHCLTPPPSRSLGDINCKSTLYCRLCKLDSMKDRVICVANNVDNAAN